MGDSLVNEMDLHYVLTSTAPGGYDAFWSNRQQALIFRLGNSKNFPDGSYFRYGGTQYTPSSDGTILVPVGALNTTDVRLTLCTPYVKLADGIYTLTEERWISATSSASAPKGGHHAQDVSTTFTVQNAGIQRAVSLEMAERVLTVAEAQKGISLMIEKENVAESLNLTLEQKIADGYSTFAALGTVTTGTHTANVSNIPAGSYRFVLSSGSVSATLDFVVVS